MLICLSCSHIKLCVKNCLSVIIFPFFVPLAAMNISQPGVPAYSPCGLKWLRRRDSNPRPSAYEADEITASTTPHYYGAPGWIRTCTLRFLRPFPLPVGIQERYGDPRETRTRISRIKSPVSYQLDERIMELPVGFEPTVFCLQGSCITIVLQEHIGDPRETRTRISRIKSPVSYQLDERIILVSRVGIQPTSRSP